MTDPPRRKASKAARKQREPKNRHKPRDESAATAGKHREARDVSAALEGRDQAGASLACAPNGAVGYDRDVSETATGDPEVAREPHADACRLAAGGCGWTAHNRKHFPVHGMTRESTKAPNPARYSADFDEGSIRDLESQTARAPDFREGSLAGRTAYLRELATVIGWDDEQDATLSYVECSGGQSEGRAFHGRPMHVGNRKVEQLRRGVE